MITKDNIILECDGYRILEVMDEFPYYDNLAGDMFKPERNPDITIADLQIAENQFIKNIHKKGVFGYVLEKWNPEIGCGWEFVDSCWGFIGRHKDENHYIITEFENYINTHS